MISGIRSQDLVRQIVEALGKYHVASVAAHIAHVQAVSWAIQAAVWVLVLGTLAGFLIREVCKAAIVLRHIDDTYEDRKKNDDEGLDVIPESFFVSSDGDPGGYYMLILFTVFVIFATFMVLANSIGNPWLWIGFSDPRLAFAHEVVQRILAH